MVEVVNFFMSCALLLVDAFLGHVDKNAAQRSQYVFR